MNTLLLLLCSAFARTIEGQTTDQIFDPPVDYPIVLAGSFGEIRSTHFHTGIDIKASKVRPDDPIMACAAGYVSRIKVNRSGYGRAIYIDHPEGYTTVYAHLKSLAPKIDSFVLAVQRRMQSYEIEVFPEPGELEVIKGEVLGLLGNSGRSYGPHLHFEIRETESEAALDPFIFGIAPTDNIAPKISRISVHTLNADWHITDRQYLGYKDQLGTINVSGPRVGLAVDAYDLMDGASNQNGVYSIKMMVGDRLVYSRTTDKIYFEEMEQLKAHVDFEEKINAKRTLERLYKLPSNNLDVVDTAYESGIIDLQPNTPVAFQIICIDFANNSSTVSGNLVWDGTTKEYNTSSFNALLRQNQPNEVKTSNFNMKLATGALIKDEYISYQYDAGKYTIGRSDVGLLKNALLSIKVNLVNYSNPEKLLIAYHDDNKLVDYGTELVSEGLQSEVGALGTFSIYYDTKAPVLKPTSLPKETGGYYTFAITDDVETKHKAVDFKYEVWQGDTFVPCEFKSLTNTLYVPSSIELPFTIILRDQKDNESTFNF